MNIKAIDTRTFVIAAVVVGLGVGSVIGYANLRSTGVANAESAPTGVGIVVAGKTVSADEISRATNAARAFAQAAFDKETGPQFQGLTINPYVTNGVVDGKTQYTRTALRFVDDQGMAYRVDKESGEVIQVGPASRKSLEEPAPTLDYTERYTSEELKELALQFLAKQGVDVEKETANLSFTVTSKDGKGYFFRWDDKSAPEGIVRFLQVGFTVGGSLLSYSNAL